MFYASDNSGLQALVVFADELESYINRVNDTGIVPAWTPFTFEYGE